MNNNIDIGISNFINFSRWICAFIVVLGHVRGLLFVDYSSVFEKNLFVRLFYFISSLGHEAVIVFFVLSGYLVGGVTFNKWNRYGPKILVYFIDRLTRIYIVLIPALVFGFAFDSIGVYFFDFDNIYSSPEIYSFPSVQSSILDTLNIKIFFYNFFMIGKFGLLGSNGPLWSLHFEWWYYSFFGAICFFYFKKSFLSLLFALSIIFFMPFKMLILISIWFVGFCSYLFMSKIRLNKVFFLCGMALFSISIIISKSSHMNGVVLYFLKPSIMTDFFVAVAYSLMLVSAWGGGGAHKLHFSLASFSYTTYLFHFPFLFFFVSYIYSIKGAVSKFQPDLAGFSVFFILLSIIYLYSYGCYFLFERNTIRIRNYLYSR